MSIDFMRDPLIEVYEKPIFTKSRIWGQWTGPIASISEGFCLLQHVPPDVGSDYREGWDWGELTMVSNQEEDRGVWSKSN